MRDEWRPSEIARSIAEELRRDPPNVVECAATAEALADWLHEIEIDAMTRLEPLMN